MKSVLSIILWVFAPMLTPYGLQIGEVKTNNQTIKIMKMNFNNPAWLQGAGNAKAEEYISFVSANGSPMIPGLSAIGNVTVVSTYNGVQTTQLLISPNEVNVNVQSDPNTQVFLYGKITKLSCDPMRGSLNLTTLDVTKAKSLTRLNCNTNQLTSLDLSANTALTILNCGTNQLTSLDLSANTALTYLYCNGCASLMLLDIQNTSSLEGGQLFDDTMTNISTLNVAGTSEWVCEQVESWLNDIAPSGGTILVDENTPQEVITAATGKSWTVEYVDAA